MEKNTRGFITHIFHARDSHVFLFSVISCKAIKQDRSVYKRVRVNIHAFFHFEKADRNEPNGWFMTLEAPIIRVKAVEGRLAGGPTFYPRGSCTLLFLSYKQNLFVFCFCLIHFSQKSTQHVLSRGAINFFGKSYLLEYENWILFRTLHNS